MGFKRVAFLNVRIDYFTHLVPRAATSPSLSIEVNNNLPTKAHEFETKVHLYRTVFL